MTRLILAAALIVTPAPVHPRQETTWVQTSLPTALSADTGRTISPWSIEIYPEGEPLSAPTESVAPIVSPPPLIELAPIEQGMNRLAELGASPYQLRVFGCLAWFESKNDPNAWSRTSDAGLWQVNHIHAWRWAGRDIFDPVVNAEVAWDIYRESGFRAWTTHGLCGV